MLRLRDGQAETAYYEKDGDSSLVPVTAIAFGAFQRFYGTGSKELVKVCLVINDAGAEFGVARPFMLAAPDFKSVGLDAEIGSRFLSIELLFGSHGCILLSWDCPREFMAGGV